MDPQKHKWLTGVDNALVLDNFKYLNEKIKERRIAKEFAGQIRLRYLLIPGITDTEENLTAMCDFVKQFDSLDEIEILKYSDIGKFKWEELFGKYSLNEVRNATKVDVENVAKFLRENMGESRATII
jgi:pyruvate formate lyase activating enzyme